MAPASRPLSVLVVDDDRDAADTLALFLRMNGHDARAAYAGEQALSTLAGWHTDAVILDIKMTGMDGIEVAHRVCAAPQARPLLVALTGLGTNGELDRVRAAPFDHHFLKPADPRELLDVLRGHAERAGALAVPA
jgi:CheY-like chemotaxis protein